MEKQYVNDWEAVVRSLIGFLKKGGIEVYSANNGEDGWQDSLNTTKLANIVCECDEGHLRIRRKGETERLATLFIVLGNNPSELVADCGYPESRATEIAEVLEPAWEKFTKSWEKRGDAVPKKERKAVKN